MKHYAIARTEQGTNETLFYGPVWGSFYAPDWYPYPSEAQTYSSKAAAIADAKTLKIAGLRIVLLGTFGARHACNRVINPNVFTLRG